MNYICILPLSGLKSDDPLHPAFNPTLFVHTTSKKRRQAEAGLERHKRLEDLRNKRSIAVAPASSPEAQDDDDDDAGSFH